MKLFSFLCGAASHTAHVLFSFLFSPLFSFLGWGVGGYIISCYICITFLNMLPLIFFSRNVENVDQRWRYLKVVYFHYDNNNTDTRNNTEICNKTDTCNKSDARNNTDTSNNTDTRSNTDARNKTPATTEMSATDTRNNTDVRNNTDIRNNTDPKRPCRQLLGSGREEGTG